MPQHGCKLSSGLFQNLDKSELSSDLYQIMDKPELSLLPQNGSKLSSGLCQNMKIFKFLSRENDFVH